MNTRRRLITIVLITLAVIGLLGFLWWWFFGRTTPQITDTGSFGQSGSRPVSTGTSGGTGGQGTAYGGGGGTSSTGNIPITTGGGTTGQIPPPITSTSSAPIGQQPEFSWAYGNATLNNFTPGGINSVNELNPSGSPNLKYKYKNPGDLTSGGYGAGIIGAVAAACTISFFTGTSGGAALTAALAPIAVTVNAPVQNAAVSSDTMRDNYLNCIARTIARAAVEQITISVVNWINGGFQGRPSFVTNYNLFLSSVADQAAGAFIQGTALSFLCSPFQLQVKIAIARAYAASTAPQCTLTGITANINAFLGNFSNGGWGTMLSFVSESSNNPFSGYMYGQVMLNSAVLNANATAVRDMTLGQGFLSFTQGSNCTTVNGQISCRTQNIQTPGTVIRESLNSSLKSTYDSLNMAKNFDEIISAIITQLQIRLLYGLSTLSGENGYQSAYLSNSQNKALKAAQVLLTDMQQRGLVAQQYGSVEQGSITDIQDTQYKVSNLATCWTNHASSTGNAYATSRAAAANSLLVSYEPQITLYNNNILKANVAITKIEQLASRAMSASNESDVNRLQTDYETTIASGILISDADLATAQQNRTTLQSQLASQNDAVAAELQQCTTYAQ